MELSDHILCPTIVAYDDPPRDDATIVQCVYCKKELWIAPSGVKTGLAPVCDECVVPMIVADPNPVALIYTPDAQAIGLIPKDEPERQPWGRSRTEGGF